MSKILKNNTSQYLDLECLKSAGDARLVPEVKKKSDEKEEPQKKTFSIYEEVKKLARKRYMPKSMGYTRYTDLALRFFMNIGSNNNGVKLCFDQV